MRIHLAYDDRPVRVRGCDSPGCACSGEYRAPKDRELSAYYWFCLDHVRDYNSRWNYFAGMSDREVETYNRTASVWERPSWPMGGGRQREQQMREQVFREFFGDPAHEPPRPAPPMDKAEREALAALELTPPVDFAAIKAQYRALVKRHHPDANNGCRTAEETFKTINQAFTTLRKIHVGEGE